MTENLLAELEIPGELPTRNEAINTQKSNKYGGSRLKNKATDRCTWPAKGLPEVEAVKVEATFYRTDRRTDPDNIISAIKYVMDGLEAAGVITNDGWEQVKPPFKLGWALDKRNPRTEVKVLEVKDGQ